MELLRKTQMFIQKPILWMLFVRVRDVLKERGLKKELFANSVPSGIKDIRWLEISCQHGRAEQPSVGTSAWWQEARGCPTCGTGAVRLIPLDNSSPNQSYLGPVRLRYHEIWDQPASVVDALVFSPLPHTDTLRVDVVQRLHTAWQAAYAAKPPRAKKFDSTSVPQVEVLIRVRDVSAEDASNVWNAVRGVREEKDVVFIPGVIRRLRLLDPTTPITADTSTATRAGDLFIMRYGSRPMVTDTAPKKADLRLLGDSVDWLKI